jgi:hypothetical protein
VKGILALSRCAELGRTVARRVARINPWDEIGSDLGVELIRRGMVVSCLCCVKDDKGRVYRC